MTDINIYNVSDSDNDKCHPTKQTVKKLQTSRSHDIRISGNDRQTGTMTDAMNGAMNGASAVRQAPDIKYSELKYDLMNRGPIATFLAKIKNKYSDGADEKHLCQMYDIGILIVNKNFNKEKMIQKLNKIIDERSQHQITSIRENKRACLIDALKKGISDAQTPTYRAAYDSSGRYQYDDNKLKKRAYIDGVLEYFCQ